MRLLSGEELAGFIKERQAHEVRSLVQSGYVQPKLAIILTIEHPVIEIYVNKKKRYGADIGVDVDIYNIKQDDVSALLKKLNADKSVHGIIIQLPLERPDETDEIVNQVAPEKDVDALGKKAEFDPATPMGILWLLAGYNIELRSKKILLIGHGRLVGAPLERMLKSSGYDVSVADRDTKDLKSETLQADVIITATGSPAILYPQMIKLGAVLVDAGVAGEGGKTVGDVAPEMFEREDLIITPAKGGVGPLTVCALFDNVIRSARRNVH